LNVRQNESVHLTRKDCALIDAAASAFFSYCYACISINSGGRRKSIFETT
jgi:hypothetical protein